MKQRRSRTSFFSGISPAPGLLGTLCLACPDHIKCSFTERVMAAATAPSPAVVALRLRHGAPLYHEGMPLTCLFIVCEGLVAQSFSRQHAHTFYIHGKGSCPDLIDTLSGISVHRTSAFAMGDTVVASIPREELRMDTDSLTPNATSLLKQIVRQAKGLEDHFLQGPSDRSYDRVVNLFHQLLYASGQINASDTILPLP
ncbi:MAG: cyclic nucleotide-binding domain-containing protein, partial [Nitrospira sp.]|nr:cyclic nucleotide-binding domain-containing protein [Nitrospira sp.]